MLVDWTKKDAIPEGETSIIDEAKYFLWKFLNFITLRDSSYQGHYILAVSADDKHIFFLNPGSRGLQRMTHANFEVSRKARGTDQDLIFIYSSK